MLQNKIAELLERSAAASFNGLRTTDYATDYIFRGKSFGIENLVIIDFGDLTYDIVFDTTGMTRSLVALPTAWYTSAGDVTINLGSCDSYTGGTILPITNRNYAFSSSYPSEITFKYDVIPTGYSAGSTNLMVGSAATNQNSGGGGIKGTLPIVLETNIKYIFRVANNAGVEVKFAFAIFWYEL